MKNLTLKIDETLLNRVRHVAVDEEKSVSAWVSDLIKRSLHERDQYESQRRRALLDLEKPLSLGGEPIAREDLYER